MASFVYDGRPLYVMDSDYELTKITIDSAMTVPTGTVNTADIHPVEQEGVITFINNEDYDGGYMVTIPEEEYLDLIDARDFRDSFKAILSTLK